MPSISAESLARSTDQALKLLAAAVRDCPEALWETPMWRVPAPDRPFLSADWEPVTDPALRRALVQRWVRRCSTPWGVA